MSLADHIVIVEFEWRSGRTLEEIGARFGVTRERVRQVLRKFQIPREVGGISERARIREAARLAARDRKYKNKYGLTHAEYQATGRSLVKAFTNQKRSAKNRGIPFNFDFKGWHRVWLDSGKLNQRGLGKDLYCMSRIGDSGAYEAGNVLVVTNSENCRFARVDRETRGFNRTAVSRGVYLQYPGSSKPYLVRYGSHNLGHFATAEEAIKARERVMAILCAEKKRRKQPSRRHRNCSGRASSARKAPAALSDSSVGGE